MAPAGNRSDTVFGIASGMAALSMLAMAISISATHILIGITLLLWIYAWIRSPRRSDSYAFPSIMQKIPPVFRMGLLLYGIIILSTSIQALGHDPLNSIRNAVRNEWSDFALMAYGLMIYDLSRRKERNRRILMIGLWSLIIALILSGVMAMFFEHRLGRIIRGAGEIMSAGNRPQHPLGLLGGLQLYRPIGFMNTRLTYAGLLILILPFTLGEIGLVGSESNRARLRTAGLIALSIAGVLVLLANGSRSAQLGFLFCLPALVWIIFRQVYGQWGPGIRTIYEKRRRLLVMMLICGLPACAAFIWAVLPFVLEIKEQLQAMLVQRHTDYFRPILWTGSLRLIEAHPILGVGAGNFKAATLAWRDQYLLAHPDLLYFFKNTPDGHAHNDVLHLSVVGGIPAGLSFLGLVYLIIQRMLRSAQTGRSADFRTALLFCGSLAFFIAGIAQCYFQDDEVVVVFWTVLALASAWQSNRPNNSHSSPDR